MDLVITLALLALPQTPQRAPSAVEAPQAPKVMVIACKAQCNAKEDQGCWLPGAQWAKDQGCN